MLQNVAEIILSISNTSKKSEKEAILSAHKDNTLLKSVLNHIFNPYIKTNIAKKKLSKEVKVDAPIQLYTFDEYINYLGVSTGKDENISVVRAFIASQPAEIHWLLEAMATKELKIGATSSTINKAFGYVFIPEFDVMLAEKYIEVKKVKGVSKTHEHWRKYLGERVIATKKLDGNRDVVFVREDGSVTFYSREGHILEGCVELAEAFSQFPKGMVYDGEMLATNEEGLNSQALFKKTSKIIKKKGEKRGLEFHAFDLLPIAEFEKGGFDVSCEKRKQALSQVVSNQNHPLIHYVEPLYIGEFDFDIIEKFADTAKKNEEEGIMVQLADAPYSCKRTFDILKVKSFESADIRCVGVYEGHSGRNIGSLGGLVLDFKGYRVNVGTGLSHELRDEIWADPSKVIGKIVEIKYFEEFEDENGKLDLRFASFKTIRDDKTEPSYH